MDFFRALQKKGLLFSEEQKKAICHVNGPLLVDAGPGSGKTFVIAARTAYLIKAAHIDPSNILVITFTRAAANEMRSRFTDMPGITAEHIKRTGFGTFHAVYYRMINSYYGRHLNVLDGSKSYAVIKSILRSMGKPSDDDFAGSSLNQVSLARASGEGFANFKPEHFSSAEFSELYRRYQCEKRRMKSIDFDDMIAICNRIIDTDEGALSLYRRKYRYFLIDEFQDASKAQFEIIKKLSFPDSNICVVGDDDQSIYGFRGASPGCMLEFENRYAGCTTVILDKNYRSTANIVEASDRVIAFNTCRKEKHLNSVREKGVKPFLITPGDEDDEAAFIADTIQAMVKEGASYSDFAVLYRVRVQSRPLIDELAGRNIPFNLREGMNNFYTHWICSDITCYLKLSVKAGDAKSLFRIVNRPNRHIDGSILNRALANIKAGNHDLLSSFADSAIRDYQLKSIRRLVGQLNAVKKMSPQQAVIFIREEIGYQGYVMEYCADSGIDFSELQFIFDGYQMSSSKFTSIDEFLCHVEDLSTKLKQGEDAERETDGVSLSTIHSAKGLEFKCVFAAGVAEGMLPHSKNAGDPKKIEEERRLFYVAVTRARDMLFVSAPKRMGYARVKRSRFFDEIGGAAATADERGRAKHAFRIGELIYHKLFGTGRIADVGQGFADVRFNGESGIKRLDIEENKERSHAPETIIRP